MKLPMSNAMYPEELVQPMRAELTGIGFEELRTPDAVDETLPEKGTTLVVVNSICGCAARMARPAVKLALERSTAKPEHLATVFAGQDREATDRARSYFTGYPPSSPSIALLRDGQIVFMLERWQIEGRPAPDIARDLQGAFEQHCN
jgi:putative YphP/YqiW family bacilliredoxin